jgi:hypothetical protein
LDADYPSIGVNLPRRITIRYTERLSEAGIGPSVGSVGDSYDDVTPKAPPGEARVRPNEGDGR